VAFAAGAAVGAASGGNYTSPSPSAGPGSVLDEAAARIAEDSNVAVDRQALRQAAIEAMLLRTGDHWVSYYTPAERNELTSLLDGRYGGLGLWLRRQPEPSADVVVVSVVPASPAAAAGVRVGDRLVAVDGTSVRGDGVPDVVARLRGPAGTGVTISVREPGEAAARDVRLRRAEVGTADVTSELRPARSGPRIGRIRVAAFTHGVGGQVRAAAGQLRAQHVAGIVLDLRGDPGGLLDEAVDVAGAFLDGGPVVSYGGRARAMRELDATAGGDVTTPIAVLVDGGTASAAEVVAGALQDRRRAVIVGSRTFGKGSVQEPWPLSDGSTIELTVARFQTPSGRSLDGTGIAPDVEVAANADGSVGLGRAVQVLVGVSAQSGTGRG